VGGVMFCRNCGKDLVGTPEICANCGSNPVKATVFCRFCGGATTAQEVMCPKCGAAIGIIAKSGGQGHLTTTKTTLKILAVVAFVAVYAVLALPPKTILNPVQSETSDLVLASTGYTALPLNSISATPPRIPRTDPRPTIKNFIEGNTNVLPVVVVFAPNDTQPLIINALYRNTATVNASGVGRLEDVTTNCSYKSSNDKIATVTAGGLVQGVAVGTATITVSYTAVPGSANMTAARTEGKKPITVTTTVPVIVTILPDYLGGP
jgi:hypothetical protein